MDKTSSRLLFAVQALLLWFLRNGFETKIPLILEKALIIMRTFTNVLLTSLFCELLYALPEIIKEELCNDHVLDKHRKTIEEKIAEGIDIWNDPDQDVSALCHDLKSYLVMIKHHIQSTKARFQDISLFSSVGRNEGDSLEILEISSMSLSPLRARLATA